MEPKIYIGQTIDTQADYDIFIFVPVDFNDNTEDLISNAKLKFVELSDRKKFSNNPIPVLKTTSNNLVRHKRKRIGQ